MSRPKAQQGAQQAPPLAGVRILVSRAKAQAGGLAGDLCGLGAQVLTIPFIEIRKPASYRALDAALQQIAEYDWLILTSVNGVEALFARMQKRGVPPENLNHLQVAAIGPATAKAIAKHGMDVDVMPDEYVAESVVRRLRKLVKGKRVLLVRAKVARDVIPNELRKAGAVVAVVEAYETVVPARSRQQIARLMQRPEKMPHVITFTSSSTVKNFVQLIGKRAVAQIVKGKAFVGTRFASIGPVTSATLRSFGLEPHIRAKEYTIPGLTAAILKATSKR
jgi:uroporphyrinogen-III synthase